MSNAIVTTRRQRHAFRAVAPLAGLIVAALLIWHGSYAAFTASTDNQDNTWGTGTVYLENDRGVAAWNDSTVGIFNEGDLTHGASGTGCLVVRNTGSLGGTLTMALADVSGGLAGHLNLDVRYAPLSAGQACTDGAYDDGNQVYDSTLANGSTSLSQAMAANGYMGFQFTWTVQGTAPAGATANADFVWTLTSN